MQPASVTPGSSLHFLPLHPGPSFMPPTAAANVASAGAPGPLATPAVALQDRLQSHYAATTSYAAPLSSSISAAAVSMHVSAVGLQAAPVAAAFAAGPTAPPWVHGNLVPPPQPPAGPSTITAARLPPGPAAPPSQAQLLPSQAPLNLQQTTFSLPQQHLHFLNSHANLQQQQQQQQQSHQAALTFWSLSQELVSQLPPGLSPPLIPLPLPSARRLSEDTIAGFCCRLSKNRVELSSEEEAMRRTERDLQEATAVLRRAEQLPKLTSSVWSYLDENDVICGPYSLLQLTRLLKGAPQTRIESSETGESVPLVEALAATPLRSCVLERNTLRERLVSLDAAVWRLLEEGRRICLEIQATEFSALADLLAAKRWLPVPGVNSGTAAAAAAEGGGGLSPQAVRAHLIGGGLAPNAPLVTASSCTQLSVSAAAGGILATEIVAEWESAVHEAAERWRAATAVAAGSSGGRSSLQSVHPPARTSRVWSYISCGRPAGPFSFEELSSWLISGQMDAYTLLSAEGGGALGSVVGVCEHEDSGEDVRTPQWILLAELVRLYAKETPSHSPSHAPQVAPMASVPDALFFLGGVQQQHPTPEHPLLQSSMPPHTAPAHGILSAVSGLPVPLLPIGMPMAAATGFRTHGLLPQPMGASGMSTAWSEDGSGSGQAAMGSVGQSAVGGGTSTTLVRSSSIGGSMGSVGGGGSGGRPMAAPMGTSMALVDGATEDLVCLRRCSTDGGCPPRGPSNTPPLPLLLMLPLPPPLFPNIRQYKQGKQMKQAKPATQTQKHRSASPHTRPSMVSTSQSTQQQQQQRDQRLQSKGSGPARLALQTQLTQQQCHNSPGMQALPLPPPPQDPPLPRRQQSPAVASGPSGQVTGPTSADCSGQQGPQRPSKPVTLEQSLHTPSASAASPPGPPAHAAPVSAVAATPLPPGFSTAVITQSIRLTKLQFLQYMRPHLDRLLAPMVEDAYCDFRLRQMEQEQQDGGGDATTAAAELQPNHQPHPEGRSAELERGMETPEQLGQQQQQQQQCLEMEWNIAVVDVVEEEKRGQQESHEALDRTTVADGGGATQTMEVDMVAKTMDAECGKADDDPGGRLEARNSVIVKHDVVAGGDEGQWENESAVMGEQKNEEGKLPAENWTCRRAAAAGGPVVVAPADRPLVMAEPPVSVESCAQPAAVATVVTAAAPAFPAALLNGRAAPPSTPPQQQQAALDVEMEHQKAEASVKKAAAVQSGEQPSPASANPVESRSRQRQYPQSQEARRSKGCEDVARGGSVGAAPAPSDPPSRRPRRSVRLSNGPMTSSGPAVAKTTTLRAAYATGEERQAARAGHGLDMAATTNTAAAAPCASCPQTLAIVRDMLDEILMLVLFTVDAQSYLAPSRATRSRRQTMGPALSPMAVTAAAAGGSSKSLTAANAAADDDDDDDDAVTEGHPTKWQRTSGASAAKGSKAVGGDHDRRCGVSTRQKAKSRERSMTRSSVAASDSDSEAAAADVEDGPWDEVAVAVRMQHSSRVPGRGGGEAVSASARRRRYERVGLPAMKRARKDAIETSEDVGCRHKSSEEAVETGTANAISPIEARGPMDADDGDGDDRAAVDSRPSPSVSISADSGETDHAQPDGHGRGGCSAGGGNAESTGATGAEPRRATTGGSGEVDMSSRPQRAPRHRGISAKELKSLAEGGGGVAPGDPFLLVDNGSGRRTRAAAAAAAVNAKAVLAAEALASMCDVSGGDTKVAVTPSRRAARSAQSRGKASSRPSYGSRGRVAAAAPVTQQDSPGRGSSEGATVATATADADDDGGEGFDGPFQQAAATGGSGLRSCSGVGPHLHRAHRSLDRLAAEAELVSWQAATAAGRSSSRASDSGRRPPSRTSSCTQEHLDSWLSAIFPRDTCGAALRHDSLTMLLEAAEINEKTSGVSDAVTTPAVAAVVEVPPSLMVVAPAASASMSAERATDVGVAGGDLVEIVEVVSDTAPHATGEQQVQPTVSSPPQPQQQEGCKDDKHILVDEHLFVDSQPCFPKHVRGKRSVRPIAPRRGGNTAILAGWLDDVHSSLPLQQSLQSLTEPIDIQLHPNPELWPQSPPEPTLPSQPQLHLLPPQLLLPQLLSLMTMEESQQQQQQQHLLLSPPLPPPPPPAKEPLVPLVVESLQWPLQLSLLELHHPPHCVPLSEQQLRSLPVSPHRHAPQQQQLSQQQTAGHQARCPSLQQKQQKQLPSLQEPVPTHLQQQLLPLLPHQQQLRLKLEEAYMRSPCEDEPFPEQPSHEVGLPAAQSHSALVPPLQQLDASRTDYDQLLSAVARLLRQQKLQQQEQREQLQHERKDVLLKPEPGAQPNRHFPPGGSSNNLVNLVNVAEQMVEAGAQCREGRWQQNSRQTSVEVPARPWAETSGRLRKRGPAAAAKSSSPPPLVEASAAAPPPPVSRRKNVGSGRTSPLRGSSLDERNGGAGGASASANGGASRSRAAHRATTTTLSGSERSASISADALSQQQPQQQSQQQSAARLLHQQQHSRADALRQLQLDAGCSRGLPLSALLALAPSRNGVTAELAPGGSARPRVAANGVTSVTEGGAAAPPPPHPRPRPRAAASEHRFLFVAAGGGMGGGSGGLSNGVEQQREEMEEAKWRLLAARAKELKFGRSRIAGWGLFAVEPIEPSEFVIEYCGQLIRKPLDDIRQRQYDAAGYADYMFTLEDCLVVDATRMGNAARFINHCCDPNCAARIVEAGGRKRIAIYTLRRIEAGEELHYDYKLSSVPGAGRIPCGCGARNCKGFMD